MLRKSQMVLLFLFLITESSYQKAETQKDTEEQKPSSKSDPRELSEALGDHRLGTKNLTSKPPPKKKEPITISNQFAGNNGRIHKLYYVIPESGGSSHRKKTHEVKVRLRARRHSAGGKRWRHQRQKRDLTRNKRLQRLKRELAAATLDGGDKKWSESQAKNVDTRRKFSVDHPSSEVWKQIRDSFTDVKLTSVPQDGAANYGDSRYSVGGALTPVDTHGVDNIPPNTGFKTWKESRRTRDGSISYADSHHSTKKEIGTPSSGNKVWTKSRQVHDESTTYADSHYLLDGTKLTGVDTRPKDSLENGAQSSGKRWRGSQEIHDGNRGYDSHYSVDGVDTRPKDSRENGGNTNWRDTQQGHGGNTGYDSHYSVDGVDTRPKSSAESNGNKKWRDSQQIHDGNRDYDSQYAVDGVDTRPKNSMESNSNKKWRDSQQIHDGNVGYDSHYSVDGVDTRPKNSGGNGAQSNGNNKWRDSQQNGGHTGHDSHYSTDGVYTPKKVENEESGGNKSWKGSHQSDTPGDGDTKWRERQPERETPVKSLEENNSDPDKNWRQGRNYKALGNADRPSSESGTKSDSKAGTMDGNFEWRQSKEKVIDNPDEDSDRSPKREPDSGAPTDLDVRWIERMRERTRAPRDHKFVTKSQLKIDRVMNDVPVNDQAMTELPPVIKVYSMPEDSMSKIYRAAKNRDFSYSRAPTKRIIYYATLPEIIRRPASPEWFARHSGAFGQRGIGSGFSNSLLSAFPSGPGQGTVDIARIQSALMDVRPPRDNLTPQTPQFTVVDIDRFPSLNDITSTNSLQNAGSPASGSGQSLTDSSGATEGPSSINSLHNNFISSLMTPLQMNTPFNGYQPAPYYPGPFPTRHHRFPLPMDGYRPYIAPPNGLAVPNTLNNLANYKIEHPSGSYNSGLSNSISSTKYPYYYEYTSSRVDPLKNHLLFSPTWGAAGPPLYERLTPSTHSSHSVVIDSQSININATNVSTGNSTRITPPIITNVTQHYESHEKK